MWFVFKWTKENLWWCKGERYISVTTEVGIREANVTVSKNYDLCE